MSKVNNIQVAGTTYAIEDADSQEVLSGKASIVELSGYVTSGAALPFKGAYVYQGIPVQTISGYVDTTYYLAFCIEHHEDGAEIVHKILVFIRESGTSNYTYSETFYSVNASSDLEKHIVRSLGGAEATSEYSGLMSNEDKEILDDNVEDISLLAGKVDGGNITIGKQIVNGTTISDATDGYAITGMMVCISGGTYTASGINQIMAINYYNAEGVWQKKVSVGALTFVAEDYAYIRLNLYCYSQDWSELKIDTPTYNLPETYVLKSKYATDKDAIEETVKALGNKVEGTALTIGYIKNASGANQQQTTSEGEVNEAYAVTDMMVCVSGGIYTISGVNQMMNVCYYNADGTFAKRVSNTTLTFTAEDYAYVAISLYCASKDFSAFAVSIPYYNINNLLASKDYVIDRDAIVQASVTALETSVNSQLDKILVDITRSSGNPVAWKNNYVLDSGVITENSGYLISEVITLKDGDTFEATNLLTNYVVSPFYTADSDTLSDDTVFTHLDSVAKNTSGIYSFENNTGADMYLVITYRWASGTATFKVTYKGLDAPSLDDFEEIKDELPNAVADLDLTWMGGFINTAGKYFSYVDPTPYHATDFTEVNEEETYTTDANIVSTLRIAFYDKEQNFISSLTPSDTYKTFTTPKKCRYVRLSHYSASMSSEDITVYLNGKLPDLTTVSKNEMEDAINGGDILALFPYKEVMPLIAEATWHYNPATLKNSGVRNFTLLHITDIHGSAVNLQRAFKFADHYKSYLDDILDTGDDVWQSWADDSTFIDSIEGCDTMLRTIGNHDSCKIDSGNYDWDYYTAEQCYERYFANIDKWGVVGNENLCYYYKDYSTYGIRLIVLDCMHITDEQATWLATTLEDARTNSYHVIIGIHYTTKYDGFDSAFDMSKRTDLYNAYPTFVSAVDTFISNGGTFICWLTGDVHCDGVGLVSSSAQKQLIISNNTAQIQSIYDTQRVQGTRTQDSFNLVSVDTPNKLLKVIKIGADRGYSMRHKGILVLQYGVENPSITYEE